MVGDKSLVPLAKPRCIAGFGVEGRVVLGVAGRELIGVEGAEGCH